MMTRMLTVLRSIIAAVGLVLFASALEARAEEPLAEIIGVPETDPILEQIRSALSVVDTPPTSRIGARRNARLAAIQATELLHSEGYYGADVRPHVAPGDVPRAQITVDKGPPFLFGSVVFEADGLDTEDVQAVRESIALSQGVRARAQDVLDAQTRGRRTLSALGYADTQVLDPDIVVDHATSLMLITFRYEPGSRVTLGAPAPIGERPVKQDFLNRIKPYTVGDTYTPEQLSTFSKRLRDTGAFSSVSVALGETDPNGLSAVHVNLDDRPQRSLTLGATYNNSEGFGVTGGWSKRNAYGGAETLSIDGRIQSVESFITASLRRPAWRRARRVLTLSTGYVRENTDAFDRSAYQVQADAVQNVSERWQVGLGGQVALDTIDDAERDNQELTVLQATAAVAWDGTDSLLDPRRGVRARIESRPEIGFGDDTIGFTAFESTVSGYLPVGTERLVLAGRLRAGGIAGASLQGIPSPDRYFAGGGGSVRGFDYQSLSPRDANGALSGGRSIVEMSLEARIRATERFGGVAFADTGAAAVEASPQFTDLRTGVGVGLRYYTTFGPLRLDVATPLDQREGEPDYQVYISIGHAF